MLNPGLTGRSTIFLKCKSNLHLKLRTEQKGNTSYVIRHSIEKAKIARHPKLLMASVPNLPTCTCDTMQDLPLRSEYEQTIGMEKLGTNPSIIFHTYIYNGVHVSFGESEDLNTRDGQYNLNFASQLRYVFSERSLYFF